jgi:putative restriction endonuclease
LIVQDADTDILVRTRAFTLLGELTRVHGDVIPFEPLSRGFQFEGLRVPLLGPKGIFKPQVLDLPLSIATSPNSLYDDAFTSQGLLRYRYRGTDPRHPDNVGLRKAMEMGKPLIYLHGVVKGRYVAAWPVYVVGDEPQRLTFTVAVDDKTNISYSSESQIQDSEIAIRRRYVTAAARVRLHQRLFRERVLEAYRNACSLCRLAHPELLEAAHIIPDAEEAGEPRVSNGLSFCKLHHAAFDIGILGIRPDCTAEIRVDILHEIDGPMLKHGLQAMHNAKLWIPRSADLRPDREALEYRYEKFRAA